jgi:hypothetical protein
MSRLARVLHTVAAAVAMLLLFVPAAAIAQHAFGAPATVGTSPAQVLPPNTARRRIIFHNPHASATVSCCPLTKRGGTPIACAVNGVGSITLLASDVFVLDGAGSQPGVPLGWNCVSDTSATPFTTFEFE